MHKYTQLYMRYLSSGLTLCLSYNYLYEYLCVFVKCHVSCYESPGEFSRQRWKAFFVSSACRSNIWAVCSCSICSPICSYGVCVMNHIKTLNVWFCCDFFELSWNKSHQVEVNWVASLSAFGFTETKSLAVFPLQACAKLCQFVDCFCICSVAIKQETQSKSHSNKFVHTISHWHTDKMF